LTVTDSDNRFRQDRLLKEFVFGPAAAQVFLGQKILISDVLDVLVIKPA